eukprot:TRINITY_DN65762_c11_g1_i1.p1 TRINITY_DN65762_c11_g1~~TRINITY_DN65762_c11_g1_i1.p1  ORF type:complete len:777 (-),score=37.50 TRINITY_DN65762_c11_g1_i1:149-2290(-)
MQALLGPTGVGLEPEAVIACLQVFSKECVDTEALKLADSKLLMHMGIPAGHALKIHHYTYPAKSVANAFTQTDLPTPATLDTPPSLNTKPENTAPAIIDQEHPQPQTTNATSPASTPTTQPPTGLQSTETTTTTTTATPATPTTVPAHQEQTVTTPTPPQPPTELQSTETTQAPDSAGVPQDSQLMQQTVQAPETTAPPPPGDTESLASTVLAEQESPKEPEPPVVLPGDEPKPPPPKTTGFPLVTVGVSGCQSSKIHKAIAQLFGGEKNVKAVPPWKGRRFQETGFHSGGLAGSAAFVLGPTLSLAATDVEQWQADMNVFLEDNFVDVFLFCVGGCDSRYDPAWLDRIPQNIKVVVLVVDVDLGKELYENIQSRSRPDTIVRGMTAETSLPPPKCTSCGSDDIQLRRKTNVWTCADCDTRGSMAVPANFTAADNLKLLNSFKPQHDLVKTQDATKGNYCILNMTANSPPLTEVSVDFVFFHGLDGNAISTWTNPKKEFWPAAWLPKTVPKCRVWAVGYPASSVGNGCFTSLQAVGRKLSRALSQLQVGTHNPLIFVGHSMGGLVLKRILWEARDWGGMGFFGNIVGVSFWGTPHYGSHLANYVSFFNIGSEAISLLRENLNEHELNELHTQFIKMRIKSRSFWETGLTSPTGLTSGVLRVVDEMSSRTDIKTDEWSPVPGANHMNVCKPSDVHSCPFPEFKEWLLRELQKCI